MTAAEVFHTTDLIEALTFLKALDPDATEFTFATLIDPEKEKRRRNHPGAIFDLFDKLSKENWERRGVFFMVDVTDGKGTKSENVTRRRAIWADQDKPPTKPYALSPSAEITTSRGKSQCLWFVADDISDDEQQALVRAIARDYGADPNCNGGARILRLPGFMHHKGAPHLVTWRGDGRRYTLAQLKEAFRPGSPPARTHAPSRPPVERDDFRPEPGEPPLAYVEQALKHISAVDRKDWIDVGMALHHYTGGADWGREIWDSWSQTAPEKYAEAGPDDIEYRWGGFNSSRENVKTVKTIVRLCREAGGPNWRPEPIAWPVKKENDKPISCADNLAALLERLQIVLRHNEFTGRKTIRVNGHDGELNDAGLNWLLDRVRQAQLPTTQKDIVAFADVIARLATHHPVRDYLDGLKWDGTPRIATMASRYFGADDKPIVHEFMKRWMLAAVTRVYRPGAKFDAILVLEGRQGIGKSRALATLAGPDWFTDQVALGAEAKTMIESTQGKWICEIPELRSVGREASRIKAQLSATADRARLAYAQLTSEVPRQFVLAATSNPTEYLSDPTGNRRFWPIECHRVDLAGLEADRDQLWAEVVSMYRDGETCDLAPKWWSAAAAQQEAREVVSPIEDRLAELLDGLEGRVRGPDLWIALGLRDLTEQNRHGRELGDIMKKLGWKKSKERVDGALRTVYRRGNSPKLLRFGFDGFKDDEVLPDKW